MIVSIDGVICDDYIRQEYVDMTVITHRLLADHCCVKAVLNKTVKGEELGGGVTKVINPLLQKIM